MKQKKLDTLIWEITNYLWKGVLPSFNKIAFELCCDSRTDQ